MPVPAASAFRLLGPVEVIRGDVSLSLGGPRQRALLALLLLDPGKPVATDRLIDELWGEEPPAGAATTIRSYVSRLRAILGPDAPITGGAGYAVEVDPGLVDIHSFERLVAEGRAALSSGAAGRAADRLRAALSLWRGRPFEGLGDMESLRTRAARLEELRFTALEGRIEADLVLGRHAALVDELEGLVHEHPYRERLWSQLMLALYRSERQADALAAYQRARRSLEEELGLEPGSELQALQLAILRHEVAPAAPGPQRVLPTPLTSFVGREAELADLARLANDARLVTLTGVGGAGKTRLALEAGRRMAPRFPGGAVFVDFSALVDPDLVAHQMAAAFEIREQAEVPMLDLLIDRLRASEALLIVDNCEHLRDRIAALVDRLLAGCPHLAVLATSREPLGLTGEVDYPVPPLPMPADHASPEDLLGSDAVRLFLARARDARPGLADDAGSLVAAGRICRDLDGLPLAIELAAARSKALSLDEIAGRVHDRFRFLVAWRRLVPARHRTLLESMDWSYDLLAPDERQLLDRLSVFVGGFSLESVAAVCMDGDRDRASDLVGRLVDASLVVAEESAGALRYRLLETVRQYGGQHLAPGEEAALRRRHAEHYLALAESAYTPIRRSEQALWTGRLAVEEDNFRAALRWAREAEDAELEMRLAEALWWYWWIQGAVSEGSSWLEDALQRGSGVGSELRMRALNGAAGLAWAQTNADRAEKRAREALDLAAERGDAVQEVASLTVLGHVALVAGDFAAAEARFQRSRELAERPDFGFWGPQNAATSVHNLGSVALHDGRLEVAARRYLEARRLYAAQDDASGVAMSELYLALIDLSTGHSGDAAGRLASAVRHYQAEPFLHYSVECLELSAVLVSTSGDPAGAVRLFAAADALRALSGNQRVGALATLWEREVIEARRQLDREAFEEAWQEGRRWSAGEALSRAEGAVMAVATAAPAAEAGR